MFIHRVGLFLLCACFMLSVAAQPNIKAQWPIHWDQDEVVLETSLYQHIKKDTALVVTQIPDKRNEKLYPITSFKLQPAVNSVLYGTKQRLVLVNYSLTGKYIDHRIVAANLEDNPDFPVYSIVNTQEKTIALYVYNNFALDDYEQTIIKIHPDGTFEEVISFEMAQLKASDRLALVGCSYYGLDGFYPTHEQWLLVSPSHQMAKAVTTLRYGYDFIGSFITLIDEPYIERQDQAPYLLAFKGNYAPTDVSFYKPLPMTAAQLHQLTAQLQTSRWSTLISDYSQGSDAKTELKATMLSLNDQFQLILLSNNDWRSVLVVRNKGHITSVITVGNYEVFKIGTKLYLVTYFYSEGARYVVYDITNNELTLLEDFTIACC